MKNSNENPWGKRGTILGAIALASALHIHSGERPADTDESEVDDVERTEIGTVQKEQNSKITHSHGQKSQQMGKQDQDPFYVSLPQTEDGLVDLREDNVLTELEHCIEAPGDAFCTNPDPLISRCVTVQEEGGIPVSIMHPLLSVKSEQEVDEITRSDLALRVRIGGSTFDYTVNMGNPGSTNDSLSLACNDVRAWLNTPLEDIDRGVICKGVEPEEECDKYLDYLDGLRYEGYEMKSKMDDLTILLDENKIGFFQTTPYMTEITLFNDSNAKIGSLTVLLTKSGDDLGFAVNSPISGTNVITGELLENPEEVFSWIESDIKAAKSR